MINKKINLSRKGDDFSSSKYDITHYIKFLLEDEIKNTIKSCRKRTKMKIWEFKEILKNFEVFQNSNNRISRNNIKRILEANFEEGFYVYNPYWIIFSRSDSEDV